MRVADLSILRLPPDLSVASLVGWLIVVALRCYVMIC